MTNTNAPRCRPIYITSGRAYLRLTFSSRGIAGNLGVTNTGLRIVWRLSWRWLATRMNRRWQGKERGV